MPTVGSKLARWFTPWGWSTSKGVVVVALLISGAGLSGQSESAKFVSTARVDGRVSDWTTRWGSDIEAGRDRFLTPGEVGEATTTASPPVSTHPAPPEPASPSPPSPPEPPEPVVSPPPPPEPPQSVPPPVAVPEWKARCEAIVARVVAQVRPPPAWQIECKPPNPRFDGMAFFDGVIEIYADESDSDHHIEMVVAHEIGHAWQHEAGLPWGSDGYEWWAELRDLPSNIEPNEDWADVFACFVGWCGRYAVARPPTTGDLGTLEGSMDGARQLWAALNG